MKDRTTLVASIAMMLLATGLALVSSAPASAGGVLPYEVQVTNDELDPNPGANLPDLSLREAFSLAATDGESSTIILDEDVAATYELTLCGPAGSQEDLDVDGDLDHPSTQNHALTIFGEGATIRQTCPGERVLDFLPNTAPLTLQELTLTGGDAVGRGGGLRMNGVATTLVAGDVTVAGNRSTLGGGGVFVFGTTATLVDSTLSANVSDSERGGGLWTATGALNLLRTTISHNVNATFGGGAAGVDVVITDSTIVANAVIESSNSSGSNLVVEEGTLQSSIVALGSGGEFECFDFLDLESLGDNIDGDGSCTDGADALVGAHPQLGPLADNGGPTETHRPAVGSPVFDVIPSLDCFSAEDQRGEVRPQPTGGSCDVGSVEEPAASCTPPAFTDVGAGHPFFADICWMDQMGITTGFSGGAFQPSAPVTRQSMAAFIYRFALAPPFVAPATPSFSDVGLAHAFFDEIEWLTANDIASGFGDGTYRPSTTVSRQAMAAFIFRIGGNDGFIPPTTPSFTDVSLTHPFFREIEWTASDSGVSTGFGDGTWRPASPVSRQAMSAFLHRLADVPFLVGI